MDTTLRPHSSPGQLCRLCCTIRVPTAAHQHPRVACLCQFRQSLPTPSGAREEEITFSREQTMYTAGSGTLAASTSAPRLEFKPITSSHRNGRANLRTSEERGTGLSLYLGSESSETAALLQASGSDPACTSSRTHL